MDRFATGRRRRSGVRVQCVLRFCGWDGHPTPLKSLKQLAFPMARSPRRKRVEVSVRRGAASPHTFVGVSPRSSPSRLRVSAGDRSRRPSPRGAPRASAGDRTTSPRTRSGSHLVARVRGLGGQASDDASRRIGVLLLVVRDGCVRLRRGVQGGGHRDVRSVHRRGRLVVRWRRLGRRLLARGAGARGAGARGADLLNTNFATL